MKLLGPIVETHPEIMEIHRELHAFPELGFEVVRTSEVIAVKLAEWGISTIRGLGGSGMVGIVKYGASDRAIGLRCISRISVFSQRSTADKSPGRNRYRHVSDAIDRRREERKDGLGAGD